MTGIGREISASRGQKGQEESKKKGGEEDLFFFSFDCLFGEVKGGKRGWPSVCLEERGEAVLFFCFFLF